MATTVEIVGKEKLIRQLKVENVTKSLSKALKNLTFQIEREVKQATVVDTGRLRASVGGRFEGETGIVATNVDYASFIEFGTVKMDSRHMEGGAKKLGEGMFTYALRKVDLKDFKAELSDGITASWRSQ